MALSANTTTGPQRYTIKDTFAFQAYATADHFYAGALLVLNGNTGLVEPMGASTGAGAGWFAGICLEEKDITESSTTKRINTLVAPQVLYKVAVTGASAQTDVNDDVFCANDDYANLTKTPTASTFRVGKILHWHTSTTCDVLLEPIALKMLLSSDTTTSITATGASAGNGTAVTSNMNLVSGADGTNVVVLPAAAPGRRITIVNVTAGGGVLKVVPQSGASINGAANTAVSIGSYRAGLFIAYSSTAWAAVVATS